MLQWMIHLGHVEGGSRGAMSHTPLIDFLQDKSDLLMVLLILFPEIFIRFKPRKAFPGHLKIVPVIRRAVFILPITLFL